MRMAAAPIVDARAGDAAKAAAPRNVDASTSGPAAAGRSADTSAVDPITITGCLEISTDAASYRLTETEGAAAPRARSWWTGFLMKRPVPVDLVGTTSELRLRPQVGKRVAATGILTSRELKVSAARVVAPSCD